MHSNIAWVGGGKESGSRNNINRESGRERAGSMRASKEECKRLETSGLTSNRKFALGLKTEASDKLELELFDVVTL